MKSAKALAGAFVLAASFALAQQDPAIFISAPDLSFVLRGFTEARSAKVDPQGITFSGSGYPVQAEMNSLGVTLTGKTIEGRASRTAGQNYFLEEATLTGSAVAVISTDVRETWEIQAKRRTEKSPEQSVTRINGERMTYAGSAEEGTATIPGATTIRSVARGSETVQREGKPVLVRYEQIVDITASSGSITVDPRSQAGKNQVKKGTFEGPVTITMTRTERDEGAETGKVSTYTAKGNRLTADFTTADRKIALTGNVTLSGNGPGFLGNANASVATIFVDDQLRPIRYDFSGTPAETRVKTGGDK